MASAFLLFVGGGLVFISMMPPMQVPTLVAGGIMMLSSAGVKPRPLWFEAEQRLEKRADEARKHGYHGPY